MNKEKPSRKLTNNHKKEKKFARQLATISLEKKASDVVLMDVTKLTSITDFFVICTADSDVQVKAIVDNIEQKMKQNNIRAWHKEGYNHLHWVLLDYVDVVVHVFQREAREFYNLEGLWGDAKIERIEDKMQKSS